MALFLAGHPVSRIMILGRWSSQAFLAYIRPQVLEWTNNMSKDMIMLDNFFHVSAPTSDTHDDTHLRKLPSHSTTFNGQPINLLIPRLHLFH